MAPIQAILDLSNLDPEFEELLRDTEPPPLSAGTDIQTLRVITNEKRNKALAEANNLSSDVSEKDIEITVRDGSTISARLYASSASREQNQDLSPVFIFFHGGGYCIGDPKDEFETNRALAVRLGLTVVSVGYRLAPEYPFPTCVLDGLDAMRWILAQASTLEVAPHKGFIVGGVSSGGNIANAVVYLNLIEPSPLPITGLFLSTSNILPPPVVPEKYREDYVSIHQNAGTAIPPPELVHMFMGAYRPDLNSVLFVPFNHPDAQVHKALPPTYFQVCGADPLRDEEMIYERMLREEYEVPTKMDIYPGLPHHFWEFFPKLTSHIQKRNEDTIMALRWLLEADHSLSSQVAK